MKSITELSKLLDCNLYALSKIFVKNRITIYEQIEYGISDGFIADEIFDLIKEKVDKQISSAFTIDQILENKSLSVPINQGAYIYFLLVGDIVVYIGQSNQILDRIQQHINSDKKFDYVSIFLVDKKELDEIEQIHIYLFNPYLNKCKYDKISIIDTIIKRCW